VSVAAASLVALLIAIVLSCTSQINVGLIAVALSGISATRFMLLNAVAAVIWATSFGILGFLLGNSVAWLLGEVERYERPIALVLLALTVVWVAYHQWLRWRGAGSAGAAPTLGRPT